MAARSTIADKARTCGSWMLFACNMIMFLVLIAAYGLHRTNLGSSSDKWDGPTVATLVLTAATIVMAGVTLMVGLVAVWGYSTLRDQAEKIASDVAERAIEEREKREILARQASQVSDDTDISAGYGRNMG